jgi:hypothetical protein
MNSSFGRMARLPVEDDTAAKTAMGDFPGDLLLLTETDQKKTSEFH